MLATVAGRLGRSLAVIVAVPGPTLVTKTFALVAFAGIVTLEATVATVVSLEIRLNVRPPAGSGADRFNPRVFKTLFPAITRLDGWKLSVAPTVTC